MMTRLLMAIACAVALPIATADAQTTLTRNQIVNSLYQTEGTVARLDPIALEREAAVRAASGGDNATGPLSDNFRRLPQISMEINFDRGSARIKPESYHAVGLIADAIHTPYLMGQRLVVVGHTDATGGRELNLRLSKERAASVMNALTTTFNVPPSQMVAIGLGEEQLEDPGNPDAAINRRVQIINLGQ